MPEIILVLLIVWGLLKNKLPLVLLCITILYKYSWFFGDYVSELLVVHNFSDIGALFIIATVIKLHIRKFRSNETNYAYLKNGFKVFFLFFLLCSFIDLVFNHTSVVSQIKAIRNYVPLLFLLVVHKIRKEECIQYFRLLIIITVVFSVLFVVEQLVGISITGAIHSRGGERAPLPSPLALLCFALLISNRQIVSSKVRVLFFISLLSNVVLCGSRSFFLSYVFVFALYILTSRPSYKKFLMVLSGCIAIIFVFSTDNILSERFSDSKEDIASLRANTGEVEGNFSFRILLMTERLDYVANSLRYSLFGIGNIEEKDMKKEIFHIGHTDDSGKVYQIDTGDIAWPIAFLRWGLLGTLIYLLLPYRKMLFYYYYRRRKSSFAHAVFLYLSANLFIISWTYPDIANMDFWIAPIVLLPVSRMS